MSCVSLWALGECSAFCSCLQLDAGSFVPLCSTCLQDPSPASASAIYEWLRGEKEGLVPICVAHLHVK